MDAKCEAVINQLLQQKKKRYKRMPKVFQYSSLGGYSSFDVPEDTLLTRGFRQNYSENPQEVQWYSQDCASHSYSAVCLAIYSTTQQLRLFHMTKANLEKALKLAEGGRKQLLRSAIMEVTGVGTPLSKSGQLLVNTRGYLTETNKKCDTYSMMRLAKEMKQLLSESGFDGWLFNQESKALRHHGMCAFPDEIMLWDAYPAKVKLLEIVKGDTNLPPKGHLQKLGTIPQIKRRVKVDDLLKAEARGLDKWHVYYVVTQNNKDGPLLVQECQKQGRNWQYDEVGKPIEDVHKGFSWYLWEVRPTQYSQPNKNYFM